MAKTVLVLDDSASIRRLVAATLQGAGYHVVEAQHGGEGIAALDREPVDAIVTDLNMPVMNGLDFVRAARRRPGNRFTPILMLTTETGDAKKQEGRAAGCTGWINKPVSPQTLLQVLARVVP